MNWRLFSKGMALLTTLALAGFLLKITSLGSIFEQNTIDDLVKGQGLNGQVIFLGAGAVLTALGFSRQAVAFMGGYAFGLAHGIGISLLATVIGCSLTFFYSRFLGREVISKWFSERTRHIDNFLSDHPFTMTLLIRLLPVGSNVLTNLAAGFSSVSGPIFIAASAFGYVPQMIIFALLGSGVHLDMWQNIGLSAVLFIASGIIGIYLYRKYRRGKRLGNLLGRGLENEDARSAASVPETP